MTLIAPLDYVDQLGDRREDWTVVGCERGITDLQPAFDGFLRHQVRILISSIAYPRTAIRRAAATRPRKVPMKHAATSLADIARPAKPALFLTSVCLRMSCAT
jgi:hypothetical protein